ncbi:MAG: hypothetical protein OXI24_13585 [Candidatus Poribacteria bacterium]|nr:hypothetical protein [Candidatus Poribacteria bacterium]
MEKIKLEMRKALKFSLGILITLFSITGCSDMPYIGSVLMDHEVDRYLVATDGNVVCFQDDLDSTCIRLRPEAGNGVNAINPHAIHIYPQKRVYVFYHEGNPILRAERATITQALTGANSGSENNNNGNNEGDGSNNNNGDGGNNNNANNGNGGNNNNNGNNNGVGNNNNGNNGNDGNSNNNGNNGNDGNNNNNNDNNGSSDDGHGWIIWVYYPEGTNPEAPPTLSESGVTVTINGKQLTDSDITGFAQFIGTGGETGIQFFYPTQSAELLDLKVRLEGVVDADETAKFNINYLWKS